MKRTLSLLALLFALLSSSVVFAAGPALAELPLGPLATQTENKPGAKPGIKVTATATYHYITFTWTKSTSSITGQGANLYFGTASGGETTTAVNSALMTDSTVCSGTACTASIYASGYTGTGSSGTSSLIVPLATIYATMAECAVYNSAQVCSSPTSEVSCQIPLLGSDLATPTGLAGTAH